MFFIAGINPKIKHAGGVTGTCPACGQTGKLFVVKQYQSLSLFFLPVFSFGKEYLATCGKCASVMELTGEAGKRVEQSPGATLAAGELTVIKNNSR